MNIILSMIKRNNRIVLDEIAETLNVSKRTVRRDIEKLKSGNILKRIGSERNGHWEVLFDGKR